MMMVDAIALAAVAALFLIWLGYPAVIAAAAVLTPQRRVPAGAAPRVSVVLASRDSPEAIRARVENLLDTKHPAELLDVVVTVDGAGVAAVAGVLGEYGRRVTVVPADGPGGKAAALNAGVRAAAGELLVFADTHQRFRPDTIPHLSAPFADPKIGGVSGSLRLPPTARSLAARYWAFERWLRRMEARVHSTVGATGAVYAIRHNLWRPLPSNLILDDVYTPMQIVLGGHRVTFEERAVADETRTPSPAQEYGRKVRTLTGVVQLCAWLPAILVPVRNPVWIQFVCHKLLRMLTPYLTLAVGVWAVLRVLGAIGAAPVPARAMAALGVLASAVWIGRAHTGVAARIRRAAAEGILMQKAVIVAGLNGLRGRWQVWDG